MSPCFVFRLTRRATMALRQRRTLYAHNGGMLLPWKICEGMPDRECGQ